MITGHHGRKSRCIASHPVTLHNHTKKTNKELGLWERESIVSKSLFFFFTANEGVLLMKRSRGGHVGIFEALSIARIIEATFCRPTS
jgi:hypothetical protein